MNNVVFTNIESLENWEHIKSTTPYKTYRFLEDHKSIIEGFSKILKESIPELKIMHGRSNISQQRVEGVINSYLEDFPLREGIKKTLFFALLDICSESNIFFKQ